MAPGSAASTAEPTPAASSQPGWRSTCPTGPGGAHRRRSTRCRGAGAQRGDRPRSVGAPAACLPHRQLPLPLPDHRGRQRQHRLHVDLSTDLAGLLPLVAPLISGHSDLAIGTRSARSSRVVRGPKRQVISRCYNTLLRGALRTRFSDAQCGFKAIRADVAAACRPRRHRAGRPAPPIVSSACQAPPVHP